MTDSREDKRLSRGRQKPQESFPVAGNKLDLPGDYQATLADLKQRIKHERLRITLSANAAMILLYWDIGQAILDRQQQQGWGAKVIDRLSHDLNLEFPDMNGLSPRNLLFMRSFAEAYPNREMVKQLVSQIPWPNNQLLLDLNLYLSADDDLLRHPDDKPTIGLLLCKSKNDVVVEYALDGYRRPIGRPVGNSAKPKPARGYERLAALYRRDRGRTERNWGWGMMKDNHEIHGKHEKSFVLVNNAVRELVELRGMVR